MVAGGFTAGTWMIVLGILVVALAAVGWWGYQIGKSDRENGRR